MILKKTTTLLVMKMAILLVGHHLAYFVVRLGMTLILSTILLDLAFLDHPMQVIFTHINHFDY